MCMGLGELGASGKGNWMMDAGVINPEMEYLSCFIMFAHTNKQCQCEVQLLRLFLSLHHVELQELDSVRRSAE